jgi:hypothetical protein
MLIGVLNSALFSRKQEYRLEEKGIDIIHTNNNLGLKPKKLHNMIPWAKAQGY